MSPSSSREPGSPDAGDFGSGAVEVWAAGGIVWREGEQGVEVLVIHRPHRRDWSLPKGKLDPGETFSEAAAREIHEETGFECDLDEPVATIRYRDAKNRAKAVVYFPAIVTGGEFVPNPEADECRWLDPASAMELLTYPHDRDLVDRVTRSPESPFTCR